MTAYRAIVMTRLGGPEVLEVGERELAPLAPTEVRLKMLAAAVNHSDLDIRTGASRIRRAVPFPYVPGLEVVGEVVEVGSEVASVAPGDRAWTAMQGLGGVRAERDGGYAEYVTVDGDAVALLPYKTDAVAFAALGLAGVTAAESLRRVGDLAGRDIAITGTTGGVGGVAAQLARARGANVIAVDRRAALAPNSVDAVVDGVGGPLFGMLVAALRPYGRYCVFGAAAGGDVAFDLWTLLDGRSLTGYSSEDLDGAALRRVTRELLAWNLPQPPTTVMPLAEAAIAHARLDSRELRGRVVLVP